MLAHSLPFTREQFINLFADYNYAMWPIQVFAYLLGVIMVVALVHAQRVTDNKTNCLIGFGLALMWGWAGVAYHGLLFPRSILPHFSSLYCLCRKRCC
jgi:Family of unknown function (DUF6064)